MNAYTTLEESKQLIEAGLDVNTADGYIRNKWEEITQNHHFQAEYSEKIPCEDYDYQTDRSKNCGKNGWKESGNYNEIEKNIIEKYSDEVNLYKIKIEDHGDYTTFVSLERQ